MSKIILGMVAIQQQANLDGIGKTKQTKAEGKYNYRGVDEAINYFAQRFADQSMIWLPSYANLERETRKTKNGEGIISTIEGTFTFVAEDGTREEVGPIMGEAFDSMDKSVSKAMSVSLRNALYQTFLVPFGPGHDPEEDEEPEGAPEEPESRKVAEADKGVFLKPNQEKWLEAKLKQYDCTKAQLLAEWGRVDESNIERVVAWLKG